MSGPALPAVGGIDVLRLPCMPLVLNAALDRAGEGRNLQPLAEIIAQDPALAARLMATLPSATGRPPGPASLARHVEALGAALVHSALLRAGTDRLTRRTTGPGALDTLAFWAHSLHCAHLAMAIAQAAAYSHPEEAHLAGLFHDLGMLALATDVPHAYGATMAAASFEAELLERELEQLHTSHAEVSAALASKMGLPGYLADALLLQHAPYGELLGTHKLVRIVWVAEALTDPSIGNPDLEGYAKLVAISPGALNQAVALGTSRFEEAARLLGAPRPLSAGIWRLPDMGLAGTTPAAGWEASAENRLLEVLTQSASLQQVPFLLLGAEDTGAVLSRLRSIASALFGLHSFAAFLHDPAARSLSGWLVAAERVTPTELDIPLAEGTSLVARAANERRALLAANGEHGARLRGVDLEIARLLKADTLHLLPLVTGGGLLGVLVFGVAREQAARLAGDASVLQRLCEMATVALTSRRAAAEQQRLKDTDLRERMRLSIRRLVHEARNPLTVIKTHLELLSERVQQGQPVDRDIRVLGEEINRVGDIVGRIGTADLAAERGQAPVDLNALVRELLLLYQEPLFSARGVTVDLDLHPRLPAILSDANAIKQVLLNFWKNASEAMPTGGKLRIATDDRVNYEGQLMVELIVADNGAGMRAEVLEVVFSQRLMQSKGAERGYGLSNALALIKQLGGHLLCRSEPERGSTFTVLLPRMLRAAPASA